MLAKNSENPHTYLELAREHRRSRHAVAAAAVLEQALERCPPDAELYRAAAAALRQCNRFDDALAVVRRARALFPARLDFAVGEALLLPVLYDTPEQIEACRHRYARGLADLKDNVVVDTPAARRDALQAIGGRDNFYLAYQGQSDRELQAAYGQLAHRIMAANFPEWVRPLNMPPVLAGARIRVGYISECFYRHSVCKLFLGWLEERDRDRLEVFAYHVGPSRDAVTDQVRRACDHFRHLPGDLEQVCRTIRADELHVATYLAIGLNGAVIQLAALRLAPVQCQAWGHPLTSGSPEIDYFLSADLMEPADGQEHYAERLIRLPGIGICFPKPMIPRVILTKSRGAFGLASDRVVYVCGQSTFKYLPQHDDLFPRIARRVPTAQFIFVQLNDALANAFGQRLARAFESEGLDWADYCVMSPRLDYMDYWNLHLVADVFLDTLEYSGGVTTLEAIACGLPIVTLPGRFMRGRHSAGILKQLGVTDTIARDKSDYVEIAARLGRDHAWRTEIVQRMAERESSLYSDTSSVRSLEEFYRSVVEAPAANA